MKRIRKAAAALWSAFDLWDVITLAGAGLLGGGVWAQWGSSWAYMLWGALLLAVAGYREWRVGKHGPAR